MVTQNGSKVENEHAKSMPKIYWYIQVIFRTYAIILLFLSIFLSFFLFFWCLFLIFVPVCFLVL